jgi:hypothetical protein
LARAFRIAVKSGLLTIVPPFPDRLDQRRKGGDESDTDKKRAIPRNGIVRRGPTSSPPSFARPTANFGETDFA